MFRLLPWPSSGFGGNQIISEDIKMLVSPQQRKSPVLDLPVLHKLKRKRTDSHDSIVSRDATLVSPLRMNHVSLPPTLTDLHVSAPVPPVSKPLPQESQNTVLAQSPSPNQVPRSVEIPDEKMVLSPDSVQNRSRSATKLCTDVERLRQTIDAQLSLEVLLKHNELRLIDQEIAKCQVALEQLRRCAEIPYPAGCLTGMSPSVSQGTGFSVLQAGQDRQAVSPAPWGVTDGPYSRHYARWLLPDPQFDGGELEPTTPYSPYSPMDCRTTRSLGESSYMAGKSRSQRSSVTTKLQALSSGYLPPREKAGPMIIKRKSDGQMVKLVCLDCRRDNFSSTQGFINHCRIAHNRNFASHDAAALASGEPVEVDDAGLVIGGHTETSNPTVPGYVHPLIRSAHNVDSQVSTPTPSQGSICGPQPSQSADSPVQEPLRKKLKVASATIPNPSFTASPDAPHLSSLLQRLGTSFDFRNIVGDAKTRVDFDELSSGDESEGESDESTVDRAQSDTRGSRLPARIPMHQASADRPESRKGFEKAMDTSTTMTRPPSSSYRSPYANLPSSLGPLQLDRSTESDFLGDNHDNLSPHTIESNQAPSLVSDDDDDEYEAPSDSDSPTSSEADHDDQAFDHVEVEDDDDTATPTARAKAEHELDRVAKAHAESLAKPLRRGNGRKKDGMVARPLAKDTRRASFVNAKVSPVKVKKDPHKRH